MHASLRILIGSLALFLFAAVNASADQFQFQPNRVETLTLTTTKQGAQFVSKVFDKVENKSTVQWKIELKKKTENVYVSSKGLTFTLTHLSAARNGDKTFDSGDWELRVTGSGPEFEQVRTSTSEDGDSTDKEAIFIGRKEK